MFFMLDLDLDIDLDFQRHRIIAQIQQQFGSTSRDLLPQLLPQYCHDANFNAMSQAKSG